MWRTDPKHNLDVDAARGARIFQLEPLIHGEFRSGQETAQRDAQTAQGQSSVIIFHLMGTEGAEDESGEIGT